MSAMQPVKVPRFSGVDNRLPDFVSQQGDSHFLRSAVNVDLTNAGTLKRRKGAARVLSGADCHSFYSTGDHAYYIDYATLYHVTPNLVKTAVLTGLTPGRWGSYDRLNSDVVFSNGVLLKRLHGILPLSIGVPVPQLIPNIATAATGSMTAGKYLVAVTHVDTTTGEESGSTIPVQVDVPANGRLTLSNLASGKTKKIYLSPPNGDVMFLAAQTGGTSIEFPVVPSFGHQLLTLFLTQMPAGDIVRFYYGRLCVAIGNTLYYSEPFAPGLHNPARNYIQFDAPITVIEPCVSGAYVVAEKAYWFGGDIADSSQAEVLPYGGVIGTSGQVPNSTDVFWYSTRGFIRASPGGSVKNLQEEHVAVSPAHAGATLFREEDGMKQMIASLFGPQQTAVAAGSWMDAEIIRKETVL